MKKILILLLMILLMGLGVSSASATAVLFDWAFNVDGTTYEDSLGDSMPTTGSLDAEGLGTLTWETSVAGDHSFIAFFDHEIDELINTYSNEYGATSGTPAAGQSWEIDDPWSGFIYWDTMDGVLYNFNAVPEGFEDDVSMAMGWDFTLAAGEEATIELILGRDLPSGFYLSQTDPDSIIQGEPETIYFSSTLDIQGGGPGPAPVPEPATLLLLGTGLAGLLGIRKTKFISKS